MATRFDKELHSETSSIIDEQDEEGVKSTVPIADLITKRRAALKVLITPEESEDETTDDTTRDETRVEPVLKPNASKFVYTALHPAIYRFMQPMHDLDQVAEHLGGVEGWRVEASRIWPVLRNKFRKFVGLPTTTNESLIQERLRNLIGSISLLLNRCCGPDGRKATTVHGTLALDNLDVRGVTDILFSSGERCILAAEVTTIDSWPAEHYWYRKSRGVQLLNTLYGCRCPTLLVTQGHFKLFLENDARDSVYTFPYDKTADGASVHDKLKASVDWHPTNLDLFKVLVMLVMKGDPEAESDEPSNELIKFLSDSVSGTPDHEGQFLSDSVSGKPDHEGQFTDDTPHKSADATQQTHSSLTVNRARGEPAELMPRFYTGVNDEHGNPIYQPVYVSPLQAADFSSDEFSSDEFSSDSSESEDPSSSNVYKVAVPHQDSAVAL